MNNVPSWLWVVVAAILILVLFMLLGHPIRIG
jgi:bacteriorhodopsin